MDGLSRKLKTHIGQKEKKSKPLMVQSPESTALAFTLSEFSRSYVPSAYGAELQTTGSGAASLLHG